MTSISESPNPDIYERTRLPLLEADTMPTECYTSRDFYDLEIKKIFYKVWNFVGRTDFFLVGVTFFWPVFCEILRAKENHASKTKRRGFLRFFTFLEKLIN